MSPFRTLPGWAAMIVAVCTCAFAQGQDLLEARAPEPSGQVVGFYSSGHLVRSSELPESGPGYVGLFRTRRRFHASQGLVDLLEGSALRLADLFPAHERLQIGDLSADHGGKITGHASHQNGLDADVVYLRVDGREQEVGLETGFTESFVKETGQVSANFDGPRNWALLKLLADSESLERVFVDPAIKKALCRQAHAAGELAARTETLRKLRPYVGHADHFHARLRCPIESPSCIPQKPLPAGSGC